MRRHGWWLALGVLALVVVTSTPRGHTPIASRWNYNEHLFPIFRDNCGSCHRENGVAPMSLVTYQEAYPWAQSIREEVLGMRMPPWQAEDGFGDFKNGHALPAHEMDMILEWSSGGYPQGPRDQTPEPPASTVVWRMGEPDTVLEMAGAFALDAGVSEIVRYFVLPAGNDEDRIVAAVDFLPGAGAVVRGAAIFVDATGAARALDDADPAPGFAEAAGQDFPAVPPLAVWMPSAEPVKGEGVGYPLPAGADIVVRVHYKKTWITEGEAFSDQSRVGLHFADGSASRIEGLLVSSDPEVGGREVVFTQAIDSDRSVLALLPEVTVEADELLVEAIKPDGTRVPMLWLREPSTGWPTRFWFEEPVELPSGSELEVTAVLKPAAKRTGARSLLGAGDAPIRLVADFVEGTVASN